MRVEDGLKDQVNLSRLVDRIQKTVSEEDWQDSSKNQLPAWVRVQSALSRLNHARTLLRNVEIFEALANGPDCPKSAFVINTKAALEKLEATLEDVNEKVSVEDSKPPSLLAKLPLPNLNPESEPQVQLEAELELSRDAENNGKGPEVPEEAAKDLLLTSPPETYVPFQADSIVNPPHRKRDVSPSRLNKAPEFLSSSVETQENLSRELADMAKQLKSNALYFADSLEKDKSVMEAAESQLEKNYDKMSKTRAQVKVLNAKTGGTTWLVLIAIIGVLIAFFFMVLVIRAT